MKKARKSRTIWLGGIISTLGVLQSSLILLPIPPLWQGVLIAVLGVAIILLRLDTDAPIE